MPLGWGYQLFRYLGKRWCQDKELLSCTLGLPGFVANNKEDYIAKAVSWAGRLEELNRIRLELRGSMEIKHNQKELIGEYVGEMLSRCWQTYCRGEKPESFSVGEIYDVK
jgi:hypothetical protein